MHIRRNSYKGNYEKVKKDSFNMNNYYNTNSLMKSSTRGYYQEKLDFILSYLSSYPKSQPVKILDIGCNDGELVRKYLDFGDVLGIDVSETAIRSCKKKGLKCILSDIESLPSKYNNYFDIVIAGDIIEHIFDTDKFLRKIHTVLKSGGTLLLTTPNLVSLGRRLLFLLGKNPFIEYSTLLPTKDINVGHIRYYTKSNLLDQLKFNKFKFVTIVGDRINISPHLYIPFSVARFFPTVSRNLIVSCRK